MHQSAERRRESRQAGPSQGPIRMKERWCEDQSSHNAVNTTPSNLRVSRDDLVVSEERLWTESNLPGTRGRATRTMGEEARSSWWRDRRRQRTEREGEGEGEGEGERERE